MNTTEEKIGRLESLALTLKGDYFDFTSNVYMAIGENSVDYARGKRFVESAEQKLAKIEKAIKNYRENSLQDFEKVEVTSRN
jgi:5-bromo-4-chloroindolyl phosphate hydrolysis protein